MSFLFLHGLGQTPSCWDKTVNALGLDGALLPDLAGLLRGREPVYGELYAAFSEYCESVPGPLSLCGLSLGAVLALHYGLEHPNRTASLALIAPQFSMPRALLAFQSAVFRLMPERAFRDTGFGKEGFLRLTASMGKLDFTQELPGFPRPVLVLCGEKDRANRKAAESLARLLPQGEFLSVEGAGHELNEQAPQKLADALRRFYGLEGSCS